MEYHCYSGTNYLVCNCERHCNGRDNVSKYLSYHLDDYCYSSIYIWTTLVTVAQTIWTIIVTTITTIVTTLGTILSAIWTGIVTVATTIWTTLVTVAQNIWTLIVTTITTIISTLVTIITTVDNYSQCYIDDLVVFSFNRTNNLVKRFKYYI